MKNPHYGSIGFVFLILTIAVVVLMVLTLPGCYLDVITTIPTESVDVRPTIRVWQIRDIFESYQIRQEAIDTVGFSKEVYFIPTVEEVRVAQSDAWSIIAASPYDPRHRNCVDYAEALKPMITWALPSAPIGVIFYYDVCRIPDCDRLEIKGHALLLMVTREHELMFIEPRQRGNIYPFNTNAIIMEIRM